MAITPTVRFFDAAGRANVQSRLHDLINSATTSFRGAVCYFTGPGNVLLSKHANALLRPGSFFVASVDWPTNLNALVDLHEAAPGHIYIHLGGATPEERTVGRSLMHSKLLLAEGEEGCQLWVGSHNLTGQAIVGGNIEAGVQINGLASDQPIQDAAAHLEFCRATAELFDPAQLARYKAIQDERLPLPPWIRADRLLVIHAEAASHPSSSPFTVYLRVVPTDFDKYFINDREVRLYLHAPGALKRNVPADFRNVTLWTGSITGVVRTNRHPRNGGLQGQFSAANFHLDLPNIYDAPVMSPAGAGGIMPTSQIVLRMDGQGRPGDEVYSLDKAPVTSEFDADPEVQELPNVDREMLEFFTPASVQGGNLVYRAIRGMKRSVKVAGYEETMRTGVPLLPGPNDNALFPDIEYESKRSKRPADAFLFVTKHVIDRRQQ